jgi:arginine N-succinyltransferase
MELAILSGRGFTSLPEDEATLRERLETSKASFDGSVAPLEAWYTLMLEDTELGQVDGVAGVKAGVGLKRPHFSFRVVTLAQSSPTLNMRFDHSALVLVNECSGWSEVGSLFLRPERRKGGAGRLLAQSRYMLIGLDPQRFAEMVLAELRGWFEADGACPFWDNVASKFFRLPFDEADLMSASTDGQFILDLAPRHPIYVSLLPKSARDAIGTVHREGEAARAMLEGEGFRYQGLIDIFDGGPTMTARTNQIRSIRDAAESRIVALDASLGAHGKGDKMLVAHGQLADFRACFGWIDPRDGGIALDPKSANLLHIGEGDIVTHVTRS